MRGGVQVSIVAIPGDYFKVIDGVINGNRPGGLVRL